MVVRGTHQLVRMHGTWFRYFHNFSGILHHFNRGSCGLWQLTEWWQVELHCCGLSGPEDYPARGPLPASCCSALWINVVMVEECRCQLRLRTLLNLILSKERDAHCAQRGLSESISCLSWEKSGSNRCRYLKHLTHLFSSFSGAVSVIAALLQILVIYASSTLVKKWRIPGQCYPCY